MSELTVHTFPAMGTVVSLQFRNLKPILTIAALSAVEARFEELEQIFSTYRSDSFISRLNQGKVVENSTPRDVSVIMDKTDGYHYQTYGYFNVYKPDGSIDPSGIVKSYAIAEAARILECYDIVEYCLNVGGDILVSPIGEWSVGIVDPMDRQQVLSKVTLSFPFLSIATSGLSERGEHIWGWNPLADEGSRIIQATVISRDIEFSDVLATAFIACGTDGLEIFRTTVPYEALLVTADGQLIATSDYKALLL